LNNVSTNSWNLTSLYFVAIFSVLLLFSNAIPWHTNRIFAF